MANYRTDTTELTNIANAIRNKLNGPDIPTWASYIAGLSNKAYVNDVKGIIEVIFDSGYTCTCTNGTTTLTAPNTNGHVNFGVGFGNWTVSYNGKSRIVSIEKYKEVKLVDLITDSILNNNTWANINRIAQAGTGDLFWDIGDCKEIVLNGKIGAGLTLSNYTTYVFILDFNHPINKTIADNNIIFGGFKSALTGGVDIVLVDTSRVSEIDGGKYLNINHYGTSSRPYSSNKGGWKGCDLRYDILGSTSTLPSLYNRFKNSSNVGYDAIETTITNPISNTLMAALPNDFRSILKLWNRYIDFKGYTTDDESCSTPTIDAGISLLTEYEIFGSRKYANLHELDHLKQMEYYEMGNSKSRYIHSSTQTLHDTWWTSSPCSIANLTSSEPYSFVAVRYGNITCDNTTYVRGLAPIFKI